HGALTAQDGCVALSYARLTPVQDQLLELCAFNRNSIEQVKSSAQVIHAEFIRSNQADMSSNHEISIFVALIELCKVPAHYSPSERNRAIIDGVSRMQIQRKLVQKINYYKEVLKDEIAISSGKINIQLNKST